MIGRAEDRLTRAERIAGLAFLLLAAGCAVIEHVPPREPVQAGATRSETVAVKPPQPAASPSETAAVEPPHPAAQQGGAVAVEPAVHQAPPSMTGPAGESVARINARPAKTPAKAPASPAPKEAVSKKQSATGPGKLEAHPTLDLASLEKRLKETNAIGVFTKLTLKNQVDDLLNQFRAHYQGRVQTTLAQLRQPYDLLILKVLSLLQDGDPALARSIAESREAIWSILSDPGKFAKL